MEDETARAVRMLRRLEVRLRLKASGADEARGQATAFPQDDDPLLHALNAAASDAVDALLRIHSAVSPAELDTSRPEPPIGENTSIQSDHPGPPHV